MPDDLDTFDVPQVERSMELHGLGSNLHDQSKKHEKEHKDQPKETKDYFKTIAKAAEASNQKLIDAHLPYRFCIYTSGTEVFIELVVLDKSGQILSQQKKNITHQDFERLIEDVSQIEGLFFDKTA